jgi:hypothetical protein
MLSFSVLIRQLIVLVGSGMMIWGITLPLLGMKIFHDESLADLSPTGAMILVALAIASAGLAIFRKWGGLYITGILALLLLFYTVGEIQNKKTTMDADFKAHIADGPLKSTMRGLVSATRVRYGFFVMAGGAVMVVLVPLVWGRVIFGKRKVSSEAPPSITSTT